MKLIYDKIKTFSIPELHQAEIQLIHPQVAMLLLQIVSHHEQVDS